MKASDDARWIRRICMSMMGKMVKQLPADVNREVLSQDC